MLPSRGTQSGVTSFGVLRMPWAANITVHAFQVLINNSLLFEALYVIFIVSVEQWILILR